MRPTLNRVNVSVRCIECLLPAWLYSESVTIETQASSQHPHGGGLYKQAAFKVFLYEGRSHEVKGPVANRRAWKAAGGKATAGVRLSPCSRERADEVPR